MSGAAYLDLAGRCAKLDRRHTRYRFDAERDVPWDQLDAAGLHVGPTYLAALGLAPERVGDPERFQWAMGLATCDAFHELEALILRFSSEEGEALGPTRSLELLCDEERKHMQVFARYAKHLRDQHPEWCPAFDASFQASNGLLQHLHEPEAYPSQAAYHYLFWINTLYFEEFTVWIDELLGADCAEIQPVWSRLHAVHRQEEVQHLVTDEAHLEALNLGDAERYHLSKAFLLRLEDGFARFFGIEAALTSAGASAGAAPFRGTPAFRALLEDPAFSRTRRAAPCLESERAPPSTAGSAPSLLTGPALEPTPVACLGALLPWSVERWPHTAFTSVDAAGAETAGTSADLLARARGTLARLQEAGATPGQQVVLVLSDPGQFAVAFWACQLGGLVAVPLGLGLRGDIEADIRRLQGVVDQLADPLFVLDEALPPARVPPTWRRVAWSSDEGAATPALHAAEPADTALIQFSSGSTGEPQGVVLSHANVLGNIAAARQRLGVEQADTVVSWMPLHHDMGLAYHLTPFLVGAAQVLLDPIAFARRPIRWLETLHAHAGTITASPNFGLAQVLRRCGRGLGELDLSRVRCVLNGAEPISRDVLRRFAAALAPTGFRGDTIRPAYGLAEATCAVTMLPAGAPLAELHLDRLRLDESQGVVEVDAGDPRAASFVGVGTPVPGVEIRIRSESGCVPDGVVGEIDVRGPNVASGYLGQPASLQDAEGWLRTGDLGLIRSGELFVTGRRKDILFVNGRNLFAADLERVLEGIPGVSSDRLAVVGLHDPARGVERVVPVIRFRPRAGRTRSEVVREVAARLGEAIAYPVEEVVVLPSEFFPRTTSGKLQRHRLRVALERGELREYTLQTHPRGEAGRLAQAASGEWAALDREPARARPRPDRAPAPTATPRENPWLETVRGVWAEVLELEPDEVGLEESFFSLGGDSLLAVEVHTRLEVALAQTLPLELLRSSRTVRELADGLLAERPRPVEQAEKPPATCVPPASDAVAVVAMAGRFPGASDVEAFWSLLREGRCATGPVPPRRWTASLYHDPDPRAPGKTVCTQGGFLEHERDFEPEAFGIPVEEALQTDPQQRLFLELAWEALGGAAPRTRRIGVFAGAGQNQYFQRHATDVYRITGLSAQANLDHMVAARVAQQLRLTGPALTIDAACATSLLAVHMACRSLAAGECELALAGGVELNLTVLPYLVFSQAGVLSPSGRCRPFSQEADGFVPGEGAGVVLLKPLSAALRDDDPILGIIRGGATNNDGGSLSGLAPNPAGQREVLRQAYRDAGVDPATVGYVEAHGTGTPIGDPVEVRALSQVFAEAPGPIPLGSVKSNVGHLLHAAGVVSLIKVLLALRHRQLPPTLGCEHPDPRIQFEQTPFRPLQELQDWATSGTPRRAGISAFGIGGTNCHLVVEEGPERQSEAPHRDAHLLCLSAHDPEALSRAAEGLRGVLEAQPELDLGRLCASANGRAPRFDLRRSLVLRDRQQALAALAAVRGGTAARARPRLVFVFPGPGSQFVEMGRHLLEQAPAFREALVECDLHVAPLLGRSLLDLFLPDKTTSPAAMDAIECSQPVVFAFSYALARWLETLGIRPDAVIGHSAGEYAAAALAGVLTLEEAARLVTRRGLHMSRTSPGAMAAVFSDEESLRPMLIDLEVSVAALNEPGQVVVSGTQAGVDALLERAQAAGLEVRRLAISCAAHSPLMAPAQQGFSVDLQGLPERPPQLPFYSTLVGTRVTALGPGYWHDHLRAPVRFASAVRSAIDDGYRIFVELAASAALSACVSRVAESRADVQTLPLCRRSLPGWAPTLETLGELFEAGAPLDLGRLAGPARWDPVPLPGYPYKRRELWIEPPPMSREQVQSREPLWFSLDGCPSIRDHRVHGTPFAPAALLFDRVLGSVSRGHVGCALEDVVIGRPLVLESGSARKGRVREVERDGQPALVLESQVEGQTEDAWIEHLAARYVPRRRSQDPQEGPVDLQALRTRCARELPAEAIYERLSAGGLAYGPSVRTLVRAWSGDGELLARLEPGPAAGQKSTRLDPGLVDGAMQSIAGLTLDVGLRGAPTFLGFAVRRITVQAPVAGPCFVHVRLLSELRPESEAIRADVVLCDDEGRLLARFDEVSLKRFHGRRLLGDAAQIYAVERGLLPEKAQGRLPSNARVLLVGDPGPLRTALERDLETQGAIAFSTAGPLSDADLRPLRSPGPRAVISLSPDLEAIGEAGRALSLAGVEELLGWVCVDAEAGAEGFLRALDHERPAWGVRHLRFDAPGSPHETGRAVLRELCGSRSQVTVACDEEGQRWAPTLRPLEEPGPDSAPLLRPRGVYWITGGLGGLGLAVAEALAVRCGARLLLTGRRTVPDPAALARLEQLGGEPLYVPADVTDLESMRRALQVAQDAWGEVHGVIHAAGVLDDAALEERTPAQRARVMDPKVLGSRLLLEVTQGEDLDLVCLFSSISALYGVAGQTDYAAANDVLDGRARELRRGRTRVLSLGWGPWRDVGMVREDHYQAAFRAQGLRPFSPVAGGEAFLRALDLASAHPDRHLVVVDVEPSREPALRQALGRPAGGVAREGNVVVTGAGGPWRSFLLERLALRLHRAPQDVDPAARFHDLGVDSLMAVGLVRELERRFEVRLYPTLLFEHPTLDELASYLEAQHPAAEQEAKPVPVVDAAAEGSGEVETYVAVAGEGLSLTRRARVDPGPGELEIEVRASGVNFIDLLAAVGMHPTLDAPRFVPGHEVTGTVARVGAGVEGFRAGDRVMALVPEGGYASYTLAPAATTRRLPQALSFDEGAAVLVTGLTAVACIELKGRVAPGERVLIQAAAGATGLACVQLALHHGAEVFGTASASKLDTLRQLGVAHPIDYRAEPFEQAVRRITGGEGVDVIVDSLSGDAITRGLEVLRPGGRFVEIGAAGVVTPPPVDPKTLFLADQDFATVNVARLHSNPTRLAASFERLIALLEAGVLTPQVGHRLGFMQVDEAHRLLRERQNVGKVVLEL